MDPQLEEDLVEALGGCDPLELVLQDPLLAEVALDMIESSQEEHLEGQDKTGEGQQMLPGRVHKCVCCSNPARGIRYYGAVICDGCRAFFKRSIKDNLHKSYLCHCDVPYGSKSWIKCQRCRFDKLCRGGLMIPYAKVVHKHCTSLAQNHLLATASLTPDELARVEQMTIMQAKAEYKNYGKLVRSNEYILRESLSFLYHGTQISMKTTKLTFNFMMFSFQKMFNQNHSWLFDNKMSSKDTKRLLSSNYPLCLELMEACKMNEGTLDQLKEEIDVFVACAKEGLDTDDKNKVCEIHREVSSKWNNYYMF